VIISILGTSGAFLNPKDCTPQLNDDGTFKLQSAKYNSSIFGKENKEYRNSTHFLLANFPKEKFVFIGTACAISFQKAILEDSLLGKDVAYEPILDNSLDDVFEKILLLLQKSDNITLDITHGFRHQPIMAIFASTLSQFLERKDLKIVFAKEIVQYKEYEYIYLNEYIEITQISLLLTGFIRTLNFIPVKSMNLLKNEIFEDFSKSLLSNDLLGVEKNYAFLIEELSEIRKNRELKHILTLIASVEEELAPLGMFHTLDHYQKYIILSKITMNKNYLIVALAYIFESLREYCAFRFEKICKQINFRNDYDKNTAVMNTISNFKRAKFGTEILHKHKNIYDKNKTNFKRVNRLYDKVRKLRNDLAHINKNKEFDDIKQDVQKIVYQVEELFNAEILKEINL